MRANSKPRNLIGARYHFLEVVSYLGMNEHLIRRWRCRCTHCGNPDVVRTTSNLITAISCGCFTRRSPRYSTTPLPPSVPPPHPNDPLPKPEPIPGPPSTTASTTVLDKRQPLDQNLPT